MRPEVADRKIFTFNRQFWRTIKELRFTAALILPQSLTATVRKEKKGIPSPPLEIRLAKQFCPLSK